MYIKKYGSTSYITIIQHVTCKIFFVHLICTKIILHKNFLHEILLDEKSELWYNDLGPVSWKGISNGCSKWDVRITCDQLQQMESQWQPVLLIHKQSGPYLYSYNIISHHLSHVILYELRNSIWWWPYNIKPGSNDGMLI